MNGMSAGTQFKNHKSGNEVSTSMHGGIYETGGLQYDRVDSCSQGRVI